MKKLAFRKKGNILKWIEVVQLFCYDTHVTLNVKNVYALFFSNRSLTNYCQHGQFGVYIFNASCLLWICVPKCIFLSTHNLSPGLTSLAQRFLLTTFFDFVQRRNIKANGC